MFQQRFLFKFKKESKDLRMSFVYRERNYCFPRLIQDTSIDKIKVKKELLELADDTNIYLGRTVRGQVQKKTLK